MRFLLRRVKSLHPEHQANGMAVAIAILTIGFLNLECQPRPAGADTIRLVAKPAPVIITEQKPVAPPTDENLTPEQLSERTLIKKVELLEKGIAFLTTTPDYTAQFTKRELVNGVMLDEQTMSIKVRHQPFSIYMKWNDYDVGREVLYVDGVNDGKMLVHAGGWKARLPALLMAPDSSLAMQEARYPVTRAGLLGLANTIVGFNRDDLKAKNYSLCQQLEDQAVGERMCHTFLLVYRDQKGSPEYRKSITLIDKEWGVPLFIKNFGWPNENVTVAPEELDEATLIEHYVYGEVKFRSSLAALDFEDTNADYRFKRQ
jgi:hypothetical protein